MSPLTVPTAEETARAVRVHFDPFTRIETLRVPASGICEWCGEPARFRYGTRSSFSASPTFDLHVFCRRACRRAYLAE